MKPEFIKNLASQGAKKPSYSPIKQLLLWAIVMFIYSLLVFYTMGMRDDIAEKIYEPLFNLEIFVILAILISSAIAAVFLALPDMNQNQSIKKIPLIFLMLLCTITFLQYLFNHQESLEQLCGVENYQCALAIIGFAIVPSLIFFVILFRSATLHHNFAGFMIGICGGSFSYLLLRLSHSTEKVLHLFFWHLVPVFFVSLVAIIIAKTFIKKM